MTKTPTLETLEDDRAIFNAPLDDEYDEDDEVPFALTPALAHRDIINYSTSEGAKLHKSSIEALPATFNGED